MRGKRFFLTLIASDQLNISNQTAAKWITAINNAGTKDRMMFTITNAYLAGSALKVA